MKLASFFLREYRKHHRLSDEEIAFIPDIITAGAIEDFSYAYWMLINDPKRAKLYRLRLYSQVARWHHKNKIEIIKKLTKTKAHKKNMDDIPTRAKMLECTGRDLNTCGTATKTKWLYTRKESSRLSQGPVV